MKCPRCGNEDARYFYHLKGHTYCRKCIAFHRIDIDAVISKNALAHSDTCQASYVMHFALSKRQEEISHRLVENYQASRPSLVFAVCGSGKTEISFEVISYVLKTGGRVCFSIPRKALCLELYERFVTHFPDLDIGLLYGGTKIHEKAPLIICTAHQLYRYVNDPFDLMLIDEADAFPFYGDDVLNAMFMACVKRTYIKMSATLTSSDLNGEEVLVMNRRYHGSDLPEPRNVILPHIGWMLYLKYQIRKMLKKGQKVLIYVPLKQDVPYYTKKLLRYCKVAGVSSSTQDINTHLDALKKGKLECLVTTTILERGITITNVQVIVMHATHPIFDERTLMQIAGRVGRRQGYTTGTILFVDEGLSKDMKACIAMIHHLNSMSV